MTSPTIPDLAAEQIATNFTNLFSTLRASSVQQLWSLFYGLEDYRDPQPFLDIALPTVQASQETASNATAAYIQIQLELLGEKELILPPDPSLVTGPSLRNGTALEDVYVRPFKELWTSLARGNDYRQALESAGNRLRQLIETDIQLSHTHTARDMISRSRVVQGSRRVPQGARTCALCLIASTQFYRKKELMPIHPGCDCKVVPATKEFSSSHVVDAKLLDEIHAAVAKQFGFSDRAARSMDYRKIMLVREHGEYGPTLTFSQYNFTGQSGLNMQPGKLKELALG